MWDFPSHLSTNAEYPMSGLLSHITRAWSAVISPTYGVNLERWMFDNIRYLADKIDMARWQLLQSLLSVFSKTRMIRKAMWKNSSLLQIEKQVYGSQNVLNKSWHNLINALGNLFIQLHYSSFRISSSRLRYSKFSTSIPRLNAVPLPAIGSLWHEL